MKNSKEVPRDQPVTTPATDEALLEEKPKWPEGLSISKGKQMECIVPEDLTVVLSSHAFTQLFGYAYAATSEVSCLGVVERQGVPFRIERFYLLEQEGSCAHTEIDSEAIAKLMEKLIQEGKKDEVAKLKCWAHSHPGMGLFWSKTDDENCARLVGDYLVSLVVGQGFGIRCRVDVAGPVPFTIDRIPVLVEMPADEALLESCKKEVEEKVRVKPTIFGRLLTLKKGKEGEEPPGIVAHCEVCRSWHLPGRCPLGDRTASERDSAEVQIPQEEDLFDGWEEEDRWYH